MADKETIKIDDTDYLVESITEKGAQLIRLLNDTQAEMGHLKARYGIAEVALGAAREALAAEKENFEKA